MALSDNKTISWEGIFPEEEINNGYGDGVCRKKSGKAPSKKEESKKAEIDWTKVKQLIQVEREPLVCFRIVPDKSVTNRNNYKFFKDVSDLEKTNVLKEVFNSAQNLCTNLVKQNKEGMKIVYKTATDYVWYEIVIREEEMNFYVICSESNADFVLLKLDQIFPNAPIEEGDVQETEIPEENTIISDLKLKRHNYFSLRTDYSEQSQPIEDILTSAEDVQGDDVVKLSMRVQPFDQNYWSYKSEDWHKHTLKGKAPKRLRVSKSSLLQGMFGASEIAFDKLSELFRQIHEIAFRKYKTTQVNVDHSSIETREVGEVSRGTHYKMTAPVFRTSIKVASHSEDDTRRIMNLKSTSNSFIDLKDSNNSLERTAIYESKGRGAKLHKLAYKEVSNHEITPISTLDVDYNIMSDRELGKIMQLPTVNIQRKYQDKLESLGRTETEIPEAFTDEEGIHIGTTQQKGEEYDVFIPRKNPDERVLPIISSGIQGAGKDVLAANWVFENARKGVGAVIPDVIDEKGRGMSDIIIKSLPPEKLIVLDFADPEYSPYLDWAEGMRGDNRFTQNRLASELVKFFEAEEEAGVQTERYLREAAKAVPKGTFIQMGLLFTSEEFRKQTIEDCKERGDVSTAAFWEMYSQEGDGRKRQISSPILNRLHKLIGDPTLKPIFGQKSTGKINFDEWLAEGKVVICKIPKVAFSTSGIRTLVHFITVKTWLAKQAMLRNGDKCDSWLVLNEPQQFFTGSLVETFEEVFPESRKTGLGILMLFHDFAQINRDLSDIILASGANFILLKQRSDKTWKKFLNRIEPDFTLEDCLQVNMHEAMIGFLSNKRDQPVIRVKLNHMPYMRGFEEYNNESHIQECIRSYGRPIEEIEREVLEDEILLMESGKKKKTVKS